MTRYEITESQLQEALMYAHLDGQHRDRLNIYLTKDTCLAVDERDLPLTLFVVELAAQVAQADTGILREELVEDPRLADTWMKYLREIADVERINRRWQPWTRHWWSNVYVVKDEA